MKRIAWLVSASFATAVAACNGASEPPRAGAAPAIARVHQTKCGACHAPPDRGTRSRTVLEAAAIRHAKRARLTQDEWKQMIDFLAAPDNVAHASQDTSRETHQETRESEPAPTR